MCVWGLVMDWSFYPGWIPAPKIGSGFNVTLTRIKGLYKNNEGMFRILSKNQRNDFFYLSIRSLNRDNMVSVIIYDLIHSLNVYSLNVCTHLHSFVPMEWVPCLTSYCFIYKLTLSPTASELMHNWRRSFVWNLLYGYKMCVQCCNLQWRTPLKKKLF